MRSGRFLLVCVAVSALLHTQTQAETVRVFAAASLTEAFGDIGNLYRERNPGDELEFNFAGSQVLRIQIEEGAPASVFASADHVHMDALKSKKLVAADAVFARNRLVVVTPKQNPKVRQLVELCRPGIRIVIADPHVPAGRYTTQALGKMNRSGLYGDDFQRRFMVNVVSQEANVRAALAKVALGEVDAGVVYTTDARSAAEKVQVLPIPERMNVIAEYPIAVVAEGPGQKGGARFIALVLSESGQSLLVQRGFERPR
jgi:molybdate transport system substrate-binding protein